jgi:hypothetical protein
MAIYFVRAGSAPGLYRAVVSAASKEEALQKVVEESNHNFSAISYSISIADAEVMEIDAESCGVLMSTYDYNEV